MAEALDVETVRKRLIDPVTTLLQDIEIDVRLAMLKGISSSSSSGVVMPCITYDETSFLFRHFKFFQSFRT